MPIPQPPGTADVRSPLYAGGAKGDGSTDDTAAFQAAADTGLPLYISAPNSGQFYKLTGRIDGVHGCTTDGSLPLIKMIGADGSTLRGPHTVFELSAYRGADQTVFEGVHIDGGFTGTSGEHDHGISIRSCSNVTVRRCFIEKCCGDGVYLGSSEGFDGATDLAPCFNVTVDHDTLRAGKRCGVGLISAQSSRITKSILYSRSDFQSVIDCEPDPENLGNPPECVRDIEISGNTFDTSTCSGAMDLAINQYIVGGGVGQSLWSGNIDIRDNYGSWVYLCYKTHPGTSGEPAGFINTTVTNSESGTTNPDADIGAGDGSDVGEGGTPPSSGTGALADYDIAVQGLTAYLGTLTTPVAWDDLSGNTAIVGTTFHAKFQAVYVAKQALLNAMSAKTMVIAEAGGSGAVSSFLKSATFQQASAPTNPINGYTLKSGDAWYSTDTTTNCADANCTGHTLDANGNPLVGAYPHRSANWRHFWDGTAWKDGERKIVAGEIIVDMLRARSVITDNLTVVGNDNLVPNGNSDLIGPYGVAGPTGWPTGSIEAVGLSDAGAYQGTYHRLVTAPSSTLVALTVTPTIPVAEGESIYAEAMVWPSRSPVTNPCGRMVVEILNAAGTGIAWFYSDPTTSSVYQKVSVSGTAPVNAAGARLRFEVSGASGYASIDNIVMRKGIGLSMVRCARGHIYVNADTVPAMGFLGAHPGIASVTRQALGSYYGVRVALSPALVDPTITITKGGSLGWVPSIWAIATDGSYFDLLFTPYNSIAPTDPNDINVSGADLYVLVFGS